MKLDIKQAVAILSLIGFGIAIIKMAFASSGSFSAFKVRITFK